MAIEGIRCNRDVLIEAVRNFKNKRILILGDLMLDRFIFGSVSRISPEAPVPVVVVERESMFPGGAANVAVNIRSLGGMPAPLGVLGNDAEGQSLRKEFKSIGLPLDGLVIDKSRPTSVKTRIIARHQQVCRTDREDHSRISADIQFRIIQAFEKILPSVDGVIVSDYAKGMVSRALLRRVLPLAKANGKVVCVDPKLNDFSAYIPATAITPNTMELERASGIPITGTTSLAKAARKILMETRIENLLITRGEEGMALFQKDAGVTYIPTIAQEVFDVTGAGDTVVAILALGLVSGLRISEAAILANLAAGIVVAKLGTASVSPSELVDSINRIPLSSPR
jgi:rfaE bifunctional protein kinase chain/domain